MQAALTLLLLLLLRDVTAQPTAASLNLCADSILLEVADPAQIVSVSWLATDPSLSNYAHLAGKYPNNRGRIEELVPHSPDYVFTGANTSAVDDALLDRLGYQVIRLKPDNSLEDYRQNLLMVGKLLDKIDQAERLITDLNNSLEAISVQPVTGYQPQAIIFQANGYSPGVRTLPFELMTLAGLKYLEEALNEWPNGRFLSVEELLYQRPDVVVLAALELEHPALADLFLKHPALSDGHAETANDWRPMVINVRERHFNCGSQYAAQAVQSMNEARIRYLAELNK